MRLRDGGGRRETRLDSGNDEAQIRLQAGYRTDLRLVSDIIRKCTIYSSLMNRDQSVVQLAFGMSDQRFVTQSGSYT